MFALIYDTHELDKPFKQALSLHKTRKTAERALEKRMARLGKKSVGVRYPHCLAQGKRQTRMWSQ